MNEDELSDQSRNSWFGMSAKEACKEIVYGSVRRHLIFSSPTLSKHNRLLAWWPKHLNIHLTWPK